MNIDWVNFVDEMLDVVQELSELQIGGDKKLERLTDEVAQALEKIDDLSTFLPAGIAPLAKLVLDNDAVNKWQREALAKPIAEMLYQIWAWVVTALDTEGD